MSESNVQSSRLLAEKSAMFHQILNNAYEEIYKNTKSINIKKDPWAIVMGLDGTILDTSAFKHYQQIGCVSNEENITKFIEQFPLPVNPGMAEFSCSIQKLGGKIIIITNRYPETQNPSSSNIIKATEDNLKKESVCYDSIIFAHDKNDTNKNPNFQAILSGDYENIITTKTFSTLQTIAFIGNDIEDFPNINQGSAYDYLNQKPDELDKFGNVYFLLPNIY
ncbi:MAG: HAD family acid phosphatase [Burkholderiales bacterium]|nr:HAD family acid phosphatase [Burkholderiales bacterium]